MPRKRKCPQCGEKFEPRTPSHKVCTLDCALPHVLNEKHKARKRKLRDEDRPWHIRKAQEAFNRFIRTRDTQKPCVSCGRFHNGQWHAGHYRTTGAQPGLRFNELNCHKQCAPCNNHKSGNITEYRIELIRRIGIELVEWIEKDHPPTKWTIDELKAIRKYYENATKELLADPVETTPF